MGCVSAAWLNLTQLTHPASGGSQIQPWSIAAGQRPYGLYLRYKWMLPPATAGLNRDWLRHLASSKNLKQTPEARKCNACQSGKQFLPQLLHPEGSAAFLRKRKTSPQDRAQEP